MRELFRVNRMKCLERDNFTCRKCRLDGKLEGDFDVHHIRPFRRSLDDSVENLITLCASCHKKADNQYLRVGETSYLRRWIEENKSNVLMIKR